MHVIGSCCTVSTDVICCFDWERFLPLGRTTVANWRDGETLVYSTCVAVSETVAKSGSLSYFLSFYL